MAWSARVLGVGRMIATCARDQSRICRADGMPFVRIGIEQILRRVAADRRGQLPAQIHGIAEAEIEALAAQRRMSVRGVAREQHAPVAVGRGLTGAIRPGGGKPKFADGDVGAGDAAQDILHVFDGDRRGAMESTAVEIDHRDRAGLRIGVHARGRVVATRT